MVLSPCSNWSKNGPKNRSKITPFLASKTAFFDEKTVVKIQQMMNIYRKMGKLPTVLKKPRLVGFRR